MKFGSRLSSFRNEITSQLRQIHEELRGLHSSIAQIVYGAEFLAPGFMFAELLPVSEQQIKRKAEDLLAEFGPDFASTLTKLHRYSDLLFLDYVRQDGIELSERMSLLKLAIQCERMHTPLQELLYRIYQSEFRGLHKDAVESIRDLYRNADLIVLHISCKARAKNAKASADTFRDSESRIQNLIVVGHESENAGTYKVLPASDLLVVPASDAYESLASKTAAAYAFLAFSGIQACVLKVDDDIHCLNANRLIGEALPLVASRDYAGRVWHTKYGFSRSWHFDKCQDANLNRRPYGLLADASYAEGPDYLLSSRAVQLLGKAAIYFEQLFEIERGYEDLAMGKVLNHYGLFPVNYDLIKTGILASTDPFMMERAGLPPINP